MPENESGLIHLIRMGKSNGHIWVKNNLLSSLSNVSKYSLSSLNLPNIFRTIVLSNGHSGSALSRSSLLVSSDLRLVFCPVLFVPFSG